MPNINKIILAGHLTRDPELRYSPKVTAIGSVGIAITDRYKSGEEWKEETTFVDVDVFGKQAENMAQYLKKGAAVMFEGKLKLDQWDDKQTGQKRTKLKVVADRVHFIGKAEKQEAAPRAAQPAAKPVEDDDLPPF